MKKVLVTLLTVGVFSVNLFAYSQADRVKDMQTMETAMAKIQKGILYNNKEVVLKGVENLRNASAHIEVAPKSYKDYNSIFAKKQSKNIMKYAEKIKDSINAGKKHGAAKNYANIISECISCHNKIRKWN